MLLVVHEWNWGQIAAVILPVGVLEKVVDGLGHCLVVGRGCRGAGYSLGL